MVRMHCVFIEAAVLNPIISDLLFPDDIQQRNPVDAWDRRQVVYKSGLPLRPLALIFELTGVSGFAHRARLILLLDLPNISPVERDIQCSTKRIRVNSTCNGW